MVQVSGHFAACECRAVTRNRFMAKMQTSIGTHIKAFTSLTRQTGRWRWVVIAQHPNGFNLSAETDKACRVPGRHALLPAGIVKTVTQRHQKARGETFKAASKRFSVSVVS